MMSEKDLPNEKKPNKKAGRVISNDNYDKTKKDEKKQVKKTQSADHETTSFFKRKNSLTRSQSTIFINAENKKNTNENLPDEKQESKNKSSVTRTNSYDEPTEKGHEKRRTLFRRSKSDKNTAKMLSKEEVIQHLSDEKQRTTIVLRNEKPSFDLPPLPSGFSTKDEKKEIDSKDETIEKMPPSSELALPPENKNVFKKIAIAVVKKLHNKPLFPTSTKSVNQNDEPKEKQVPTKEYMNTITSEYLQEIANKLRTEPMEILTALSEKGEPIWEALSDLYWDVYEISDPFFFLDYQRYKKGEISAASLYERYFFSDNPRALNIAVADAGRAIEDLQNLIPKFNSPDPQDQQRISDCFDAVYTHLINQFKQVPVKGRFVQGNYGYEGQIKRLLTEQMPTEKTPSSPQSSRKNKQS